MTNTTTPIKIVFADDSPQFREEFRLTLEKSQKFHLLGCLSNGRELLESPLLPKADLILTDVEMPVLNGIEAAKRINYLFPNLPMIAITMYVDLVYLDDLIGAGFKGFIHKPDLHISLYDVIEEVLNDRFSFSTKLKIHHN